MGQNKNHSSAVSRHGNNAEQGGTEHAPLTLAVTGGKGGVGKTQVALNLALVLAKQGYRTLLLDGDVELANVNVMLGVYPGMTLEHVVLGERTLDEVLLPVTENLDLLPGASGVPGCLEMGSQDRETFLENLANLERRYDRVIIDTAAGLTSQALHMVAAAHLATIVVTPDPTSMTDAFSLVKVLHRKGYRRTPSVIVNMARGATEAQTIYRRFSAAVSRYIGVQLHYLGAIWRDETIAQSITTQRPVAMMAPEDPSCRQFWTLADMLTVRWSQGVQPANGFARYWARLVRRRHQRRQTGEAAGRQPSSEASINEWLNHFRERLSSSRDDPLLQYRLITGVLEALGEEIDEDRVEALQTGLAAMNWDAASNPVRRSAAAHFDQLARYVAPPGGTTPEEAMALSKGNGSSLDRLLSSIREND
ncbi:MinD-like ATPase involved in chromosome partitioning or flagellar assembly [Halospina denitrificans]|uniref:MinD-like ATPase involved in chromosome partitioning or flagellar assembly n=1 Tax=Halospina denitrificans TaxID=332522 RepID=A0A4V3EPU2_9GAMM|nr:AAA family ATPase [Halospina denitrificans]TDT38528.1 MinD-like ATPase involved in chromosome partitioning or flagellar assembly [Halospina denitrificans]